MKILVLAIPMGLWMGHAYAQTVVAPSSPGMNTCLTTGGITNCTDGTMVIQSGNSTTIYNPAPPPPIQLLPGRGLLQ